MTTEERQLSEMLHRITPEPPRRVTVEDVAFRLAGQRGKAARGLRRPGARGRPRGRGWVPAMAAASVLAVAAASAGAAYSLSSHHKPTPLGGNAGTRSSGSTSASVPVPVSASSSAFGGPAPSGPGPAARPITDAPWGAGLVNRLAFTPGSLAAGAGSLYATSPGHLDRISPATGRVTASVPYSPPVPGQPVVAGGAVWVLSSYGGGSVVLQAYSAGTLAPAGTVSVPVRGQASFTPEGVLTEGPDGNLYVAAGSAVAVVNPQARHVIREIPVAGAASSVAVSPDGGRLYVGTGSFELLAYATASGAPLGSSAMADVGSGGGNLLATSGGVWGTVGVGMSERVWFSPRGDLTQLVWVSQGFGAGVASVPTLGGGTVWIGGSHTLVCADPATGRIRASAAIPAQAGLTRYFGSVTVTADGTFAIYQAARPAGLAVLNPPPACNG